MSNPLEWLKQFLEARDLKQPDGRMLYAYRLTEQEYEDLRELLRTWLGANVLQVGNHLARGSVELFVLYGASWWQREYSGGNWRWDDVIESFGGDPEWWPPQFRSQCVEAGLQFWKQTIRTSGMKYFGVLVEQGGLPRVLLARGEGNIYALIRALMKRSARLGADIDEITAMVSDYLDKLPRSLQTESIYLLIAQVVDTVLSLKREFRLTGRENALNKLEELEPNWRARFPIALDDQAAVVLLGDLVREAAAIETETRAAPILADRLLVRSENCFSLISRIEFPKTIEATALAGLLGLEVDSLPFKFSLDFQVDKRYLAADVRRALGQGTPRYHFSALKSRWSGTPARREHLLYVVLPGKSPSGVPIPGGMELDSAMPWVFTEGGDECQLVSQGSAKVRQDQAFVVIDKCWRITPMHADCQVELLGDLIDETDVRSVFLVRGSVTVDTGAHKLQVRTKELGAEPERLVWEGSRTEYATTPSLTFYGLPKLCRYTADGLRHVVPAHELEWRRAGTATVLGPTEIRGPVDVLWRVGDEVRQRSRMVILDRQGRLRFHSGDSITHGSIDFPLAWGMDAVTGDKETILLHSERKSGYMSMRVNAIDLPPESIKLTVDWRTSPISWQVTLPFPASGGRFFRHDEKPFPNEATITRDQLLGVRLRIFDSNPSQPCNYKIAFSLTTHGHSVKPADLRPIEHAIALHDGQSAELRLLDYQADIESLLNLTDALDAVVTVTLWAGRRSAATIQIKRYEFALVTDGTTVSIAEHDLARLSCDELSAIRLLGVSIETMHQQPGLEMAPIMSEGVPTGRWRLPSGVAGSPWLVYPAARSSHSFRAVLVSPEGQAHIDVSDHNHVAESLQQALLVEPAHLRRQALAQRLNRLAADFSDPDWAVAEGIWSNLGHLTLPTLDLWRAFAAHPKGLAAFACRHWAEHTLEQVLAMCDRFQDELGVLWETIPLKTWNDVCRKFSHQWEQVLPAADLIPLITPRLAQTLRALRERFPVLSNLLALVTFQQTGEDAQTIAQLCSSLSKLSDLKARLWAGEHSAVMDMLRQSAERDPPRQQLYRDLVGELSLNLPESMRETAVQLVWKSDIPKASVANVPVLLALCTWAGLLAEWWRDPKRLIELRQFRDYDREWFQHAFNQGIAMCIASSVTLPN